MNLIQFALAEGRRMTEKDPEQADVALVRATLGALIAAALAGRAAEPGSGP